MWNVACCGACKEKHSPALIPHYFRIRRNNTKSNIMDKPPHSPPEGAKPGCRFQGIVIEDRAGRGIMTDKPGDFARVGLHPWRNSGFWTSPIELPGKKAIIRFAPVESLFGAIPLHPPKFPFKGGLWTEGNGPILYPHPDLPPLREGETHNRRRNLWRDMNSAGLML